jgi:hypothetical protein
MESHRQRDGELQAAAEILAVQDMPALLPSTVYM